MKYDVYAIGNALVDSEFEVETSFFSNDPSEKGLMNLIDLPKKNDLWSRANKEPVKKACGGSAANTAIALSQLGGSSFYAYKVANDSDGEFYQKDMKNNGVAFEMGESNSDEPTGTCTVFITPDADRTMYSHLGVSSTFSDSDLRLDALKNSKYLYVEGYLVTSDNALNAAKESIKQARENNKLISLTLSDPGIVVFFKNQFLELLSEPVDLIFCNEEEAMSLTDTDNVHSALEGLKKFSKSFAITCGSKGAILFDGKEKILIDGVKAKAINTNGAGDMFAGAFLYGINNGLDFKKSGELANFLASKVIQVFGPRLSKEEILTYLGEFK